MKNNFLQVGRMSECANCKPQKYDSHYDECSCICHSSTNIDICYICKEKICGATIVEDFKKIRHAECEKQCCHDKPLEICEDCGPDSWTEEFDQEFIKWADYNAVGRENLIIEELKKALKAFIFNLINKND